MRKKVVILQYRLLHYREDLFEKLRAKCIKENIALHVVHGQASSTEKKRKDEGHLSWSDKVNNLFWRVAGRDLVWQPFPWHLKNADLVITMQENRIISNYLLFVFRMILPMKLAYWGHGANFQSHAPNGFREKWKKYLVNKVDWWFAYTQATVDIIKGEGFPSKKITNLNNAVDTNKFKKFYANISNLEVHELKVKMGIPIESKIGIFCGSLYKDKKLDLLLSSSEIVRKEKDFHLIILGSGDELVKMEVYAKENKWVHLVGVKKGYEKALYYKVADIMLNPGLLGLHILDSFSIGMPLVSTDNARHSPEISYITDGYNAILTGDTSDLYAAAILRLITDNVFFNLISTNALQSSDIYTLDNMVDNFFNGIKKSLE